MPELWTPPGTVSTGPASASQFNAETVGNLRYLKEQLDLRGRGCVIRRTTAQTITTATFTAINFNGTELRDTDAYHSTTSLTSRITIPAGLGGWYEVKAKVAWQQASTGSRILQALVDGATTSRLDRRGEQETGGAGVVANGSELMLLTDGQYLEITAWQDTGGNLDVLSAQASVHLVAPA